MNLNVIFFKVLNKIKNVTSLKTLNDEFLIKIYEKTFHDSKVFINKYSTLHSFLILKVATALMKASVRFEEIT